MAGFLQGIAELFGNRQAERELDTSQYLEMGDSWIDWFPDLQKNVNFQVVTRRLETKAQKRLAQQQYYSYLKQCGLGSDSKRLARHEGEHAIYDPGAGYYGVILDADNGSALGGFYTSDNKPRSPEEIFISTLAPQERLGDTLSKKDRALMHEQINKIRKR
ncbi:MAG TPA: hypothetical protein VJ246_03845 [Patescibacteria group bacterium]|nr:hypothetical protein [Patescibacteria group bacterium]